MRYFKFIQSNIFDGTFYKCDFEDCDIKNSHIENCKLLGSDVQNCKLTNCNVDKDSVLEKVYFYGGYMNGTMKSGVFRGGTIGPDAIIENGVKLITDDDNYFGTTMKGDITKMSTDKKDIKLIK